MDGWIETAGLRPAIASYYCDIWGASANSTSGYGGGTQPAPAHFCEIALSFFWIRISAGLLYLPGVCFAWTTVTVNPGFTIGSFEKEPLKPGRKKSEPITAVITH
jgi:hypothetical protein